MGTKYVIIKNTDTKNSLHFGTARNYRANVLVFKEGCFAVTELACGTEAVALKTVAKKEGFLHPDGDKSRLHNMGLKSVSVHVKPKLNDSFQLILARALRPLG